MRGARGFSLIEMVVAAGISVTLIGGSGVVFMNSLSSMQHVNRQNDVDMLYLATLQGLRNIVRLTDLLKVPVGSDLEKCLAGKNTGCDQFLQPAQFNDPKLGAMYGVNGLCGTDKDTPNPLCNLQVTSNYQWICATTGPGCTKISGLQVNVGVRQLNSDGTNSNAVVPRGGGFTIPATAFVSKKTVTMKCAGTNVLPLKGFNYETYTDECQYIPNDVPCLGPAMIYGEVVVCQPPQDTGGCGYGFTTSGLYAGQSSCLPGVAAPYAPPLNVQGPVGYYAGLPPAPFYGYVPEPPPPPPPPPPPSNGGGGGGGGPTTPIADEPPPDDGGGGGGDPAPPPPPPPPAPAKGHWVGGFGGGSYWCDDVNYMDECSPIGASCWHRAGLNWINYACQ